MDDWDEDLDGLKLEFKVLIINGDSGDREILYMLLFVF